MHPRGRYSAEAGAPGIAILGLALGGAVGCVPSGRLMMLSRLGMRWRALYTYT